MHSNQWGCNAVTANKSEQGGHCNKSPYVAESSPVSDTWKITTAVFREWFGKGKTRPETRGVPEPALKAKG